MKRGGICRVGMVWDMVAWEDGGGEGGGEWGREGGEWGRGGGECGEIGRDGGGRGDGDRRNPTSGTQNTTASDAAYTSYYHTTIFTIPTTPTSPSPHRRHHHYYTITSTTREGWAGLALPSPGNNTLASCSGNCYDRTRTIGKKNADSIPHEPSSLPQVPVSRT